MSFEARRRRDEERDHEQAVVAMRDSVCRIVAARMPGAGSAATEDAVDAALLRLFARNEHLAALDYVKRGWIIYACQRLLDEQRSAAARRLDPVDAEEHPRALALSATVHASDVSEQERPLRVPEIFGVLHGDQRRWAEAWFDRRLETGKQPRGLDQALGWSASKTKSVSGRARGKMKAYIRAYANGEVCIKQRALLDTLIDATDKQLPAQLEAVPQLEAVLMHVASCDECRAAWHSPASRRARTHGPQLAAVRIVRGCVGWPARPRQRCAARSAQRRVLDRAARGHQLRRQRRRRGGQRRGRRRRQGRGRVRRCGLRRRRRPQWARRRGPADYPAGPASPGAADQAHCSQAGGPRSPKAVASGAPDRHSATAATRSSFAQAHRGAVRQALHSR